ncbi:hypothetical protein [Streptococcus intermedius]|nr:hypothetical protein [Streptococcus intermedius]
MNDSLAASRAEAERLQIEIKKEQERVAIRSLVFARRMVLGTESMVLKA